MRAKFIQTLIVVSTAFAVTGVGLRAAEGEAKEGEAKEEAVVSEANITQGQAAIIFAQRLGLGASLPASPSGADAAAALLAQGIAPFDGWQLDQVLTYGDLARIVALAMNLEVDPDKTDDPQAYLDAVKAANFGLSGEPSANEAAQLLNTTASTGSGVGGQLSSSDPLRVRQIFGQPDERATGTDAGSPGYTDIAQLPVPAAVVAQVVSQARRSGRSTLVNPVTPN